MSEGTTFCYANHSDYSGDPEKFPKHPNKCYGECNQIAAHSGSHICRSCQDPFPE